MPQQSPNTQNISLTPLQEEALKRIRTLEKAIYNEYGLRVACGIELEFYYRNKDGILSQDLDDEPEKGFRTAKYDHTPSSDKTRFNSLMESPFLEKLYKEAGSEKYEVVVGRKLPECLEHASPSTIARAALYIRYLIEHKTPELEPEHTANFWAIDGHPKRPKATAGLHVNISLWDPIKRENLFVPTSQGDKTALVECALYGGLKVQEALLPVIVESLQSLERFARPTNVVTRHFGASHGLEKAGNSLGYTERGTENPSKARLEHRLPGADADPILATLMAVGGLYYSLKHGSFMDIVPPEFADIAMEKTQVSSGQTDDMRHLLTRCDVKPFSSPIPDRVEYLDQIKKWRANPLAKEILGEDLHGRLATMRTKQTEGWAK